MTLTPQPTAATAAPGIARVAAFRAYCESLAGRSLEAPGELHEWSVRDPETFWRAVLTWSDLPFSGSADVVLTGPEVETARFFPEVRLNYAEALLRRLPEADDDAPAVTSVHADRPAERWTRGELRDAVARTAATLSRLGLRPDERLVLIAPNAGRAIVVALAAAAIGAPVSTAVPDMGAAALLARFEQVEPALLALDRTGMTEETVASLVAGLPTLRRVLVLDDQPLPEVGLPVDRLSPSAELPATEWVRRPFDSPLFIMFSSGTTGPPKAMVHGAGGTLLEHVKEHLLHGDLRPQDTMYFHTTTAWMMWNWQLSALAVGAHIVVYDGPVAGPETLWELVAEHGVTVFGTSPAYLQLCQDAGYRPKTVLDLSPLRAVLSTGAVLHDWQFDWVADAVGPVPLQSISGGTDIIGCFVLGSPEIPVRRGRCQARSLGLDVAAVDGEGRELVGEVGELVCRQPFPSRPVRFLRDPDGTRFHASYFADHPGMWTHGDLVEFDPDGSARLHGRSDGVLNIDGVRVGPSEIYTILRPLPELADTMAVERRDADRPGGSHMVLLVVLARGARLTRDLEQTIRRTLRTQASAAHVPSRIVAVPELPHTHNGKRSERAARDAVNGDPVVNAAALRNPACLDAIRDAVAAPNQDAPGEPGPLPAAEPDDRLLAEVTRIWAEVLGVGDVEPDDDFSDVGGTSRQALSLLRRVRLELGADVPFREFAQRPTPRGLAGAVTAFGAQAAGDASVLRAGTGDPVFLVPDAWGQHNLYAGLVQHLDTERPVVGLHLTLTDAEGRHRDIPVLAAEALEQIRALQPRGPYRLMGYSFGGLVAYETALLLRAQGQFVPYLGLLDVRPPMAALTVREREARRWDYRWRRLRTGAEWSALRRRLGLGGAAGGAAAGSTAARDPEEEFFLGSEDVAEAYVPGSFDGGVHYYLAEGTSPAGRRESRTVWGRLARHLLVTPVPGHHGDLDDDRTGMLSGEHVAVLAEQVSAALG